MKEDKNFEYGVSKSVNFAEVVNRDITRL